MAEHSPLGEARPGQGDAAPGQNETASGTATSGKVGKAAQNHLRIGVVVGEASGDILGAGLIREIKRRYPQAVFEGIAGPQMLALGCHSFFPQDRLAVMGFVGPLKRLPELLRIRKFLREHFIANPPDVFIGIDSPEFNLGLELALKKRGIKTVHYVSPSVWAWRQGRVKTIARAVDAVLTLFPFEQDFYKQHNVNAICVGHTLADTIPIAPDCDTAREALGLQVAEPHRVIALLPGSRGGEVDKMLPVFLAAACLLFEENASVQFVIPAANEKRQSQIIKLIADYPDLPINVFFKQSQEVMQASNIVVMASGTTTLEAMLLKKPMVIAYKVAALSYFIYSRLVKVPFIGLPNLLAGKQLAKEFIQDAATPEAIAQEVKQLLSSQYSDELQADYKRLHLSLKKNADSKAADVILDLINSGQVSE